MMDGDNEISRVNLESALKMLDEIEKKAEDPNYDVMEDAKKLNEIIPGYVYGKATDRIRFLCQEMLKAQLCT